MPSLRREEREPLIRSRAASLQRRLQEILPTRPNEADFRRAIEPALDEFCREVGVDTLSHSEYTLAPGRADAVFNRLIVEYERPGTLRMAPDRATRHSIEQVRGYMDGLARRERHAAHRLAGVVFDGRILVFVRRVEERWSEEGPLEVNQHSVERFLTWLASLSSGLALTAENLSRDFSIEQPRTQNALLALYRALQNALRERGSLTGRLFEQWRLFFSEAIDYSEAFGGRKLEPLRKWVRKAGLEIHKAEEAERFFFVLHTYFALLVKLLAWLALSRHMAVRLGAPSFGELSGGDSATLRRRLKEMEEGGIFRAYGLANLLEGDFFSWYFHVWGDGIEGAIRGILGRLDQYEPATLSIVPEETRDLFKKLYHYLLPREIRHNLGEYYTPDWLAQRLLVQVDSEFFTATSHAQEQALRRKLLEMRVLDPACGSGTFLVLTIARMRTLGQTLVVPEHELLDAILHNVVGFDLNPLAVLTARVNYLLAIADLLNYRRGEIGIPVYLADSVRMPAEGEDLYTRGAYQFPTAVGKFSVPAAVASSDRFDRFCDLLEEGVRSGLDGYSFSHKVKKALNIAPSGWDARAEGHLEALYQNLLGLHARGFNGLWARLLKNNFAPLTVGQFDYVVGNPPWINWENLPDGYRNETKPIWERYGLFVHRGQLGKMREGKKDISMLMTYAVCDRLLKLGGRLGFVITQSVLKTSGAGQGFRRFHIPEDGRGVPLRVVQVDDMVALNPFEGATNRTAVIVIEKGKATRYPVEYLLWRKGRGGRFTYDDTLEEVLHATKRIRFAAEPVDGDDATSPWLTARPKAVRAMRKVLGNSDYLAREGTNTGGANAVYWVQTVMGRPDGLAVVRNVIEGAKIKVDVVSEPVELDLLYPLLRGRDVRRWYAEPSLSILIVQDRRRHREGMDINVLRERYPKAFLYLKRFEDMLQNRPDFRYYPEGSPFYTMRNVAPYTFAPWKVVWREVAHTLDAAVAGPHDGKPTIPDHTLILVACKSDREAYYLCAALNSAPARLGVQSYIVLHPDPHILERIRIPLFDPKSAAHQRLAELSIQAHEAVRSPKGILPTRIEAELDRHGARLWGLSDQELTEIQGSLQDTSVTRSSVDDHDSA